MRTWTQYERATGIRPRRKVASYQAESLRGAILDFYFEAVILENMSPSMAIWAVEYELERSYFLWVCE